MKKFILRMIPILMVCVMMFAPTLLALNGDDVKTTMTEAGDATYKVDDIKGPVYRVWNTIATVLQVVSVAAIVFAGVKYMLAGADEKANIKNGMIVLVIGAVMVFGATSIIKIISNATTNITQTP